MSEKLPEYFEDGLLYSEIYSQPKIEILGCDKERLGRRRRRQGRARAAAAGGGWQRAGVAVVGDGGRHGQQQAVVQRFSLASRPRDLVRVLAALLWSAGGLQKQFFPTRTRATPHKLLLDLGKLQGV